MQFQSQIMQKQDMLRAMKRISHQIINRHPDIENMVLLGIRRRGVPLAREIQRNCQSLSGINIPIGEMDIRLYRDDLSKVADNPIVNESKIPFPLEGRNVILVDDVLFTGRTTRAAMDAVMQIGRAESIELAVLIDRGHRQLPIRADYVGKNVPTSKNQTISVKIEGIDAKTCVDIYLI